MDAFWIILTGALVAINFSILGSFLMLRKMAMLGDAVSHAVLPGIALAYLVAGGNAPIPMLIGASIFGLFTTLIIEFISEKIKIQTDASIGITFTFFFALGIIIITGFLPNAHIDQDCVLFGEIAYTPLHLIPIANEVVLPKAILQLGSAFIIILLFVAFALKPLKILSFNPAFAKSMGLNLGRYHYALMGLISITTVLSFEQVGAILVVAFIIIPPASAYLLSKKLVPLMLLACFFGISASICGYFLAIALNASISACMGMVAGMQFVVVMLSVLAYNQIKSVGLKPNEHIG